MPSYDEWLGELAFTLYARRLAHKSGLCYDFHWTMLPTLERETWIQMAKDIHEVGANSRMQRETRPDSSTSPLAHSGFSSFG